MKIMQLNSCLYILIICLFPFLLAGQICDPNGNVVIYSNYEGGDLNINVDQNIPNLKIGISTYNSVNVTITGTFVGNVTEVIYAGFDALNNSGCGAPIPQTTISGVTPGIVTIYSNATNNIAFTNYLGDSPFPGIPPLVNCMVGAEGCGTSSPGGATSSPQIVQFFLSEFGAGSSLFSHTTLYNCFSGTYSITAGGNCCEQTPTTALNPIYQGGSSYNFIPESTLDLCNGALTLDMSFYEVVYQPPIYPGYVWSDGTQGPIITISQPGVYSFTVGDYCHVPGQNILLTDTVVVNDCAPNIDLNDSTICAGSCVDLNPVVNNLTIVGYSWSTGETTAQITVCPTITTTYTLTVTDDAGVVYTTQAQISVNNPPLLTVSNDTVVCNGSSLVLSASGATSYVWSNGSGAASITLNPALAGIYWVEGTTANCTSSDTIIVATSPLPVLLVNVTDESCPGAQDGSLSIAASSGAAPLQILLNGQSAPAFIPNLSAGAYAITVNDALGCNTSGTYQVFQGTGPDADFSYTPSTVIEMVTEVQFTPESTIPGLTYAWDFGDGATSSGTTPVHTYETAGSYEITLLVSDANGCLDSTQTILAVQPDLSVFVPNTFTPDGDEFNHVFLPVISTSFDPQEYALLIFNRWGEIIFESRDPQYGWDGSYAGKLQQTGVYTWTLELKSKYNDEKKTIVGHVLLLK